MALTAIPTLYARVRFRSRLEARWAVFYDTLGVPWQYEPNVHDLGGGTFYLPDFWLPNQQCFVEIKPAAPDDEAQRKASGLAALTRRPVFLFFDTAFDVPYGDLADTESAYAYFADRGFDWYYQWCECPTCRKVGIEYAGRAGRICRHDADDKNYAYDTPRLCAAYDAARLARFQELVA